MNQESLNSETSRNLLLSQLLLFGCTNTLNLLGMNPNLGNHTILNHYLMNSFSHAFDQATLINFLKTLQGQMQAGSEVKSTQNGVDTNTEQKISGNSLGLHTTEIPKNTQKNQNNISELNDNLHLSQENDVPDPKEKKKRMRMSKRVTQCPHNDRKHYAKNLCSNCYHLYGRNKKAWSCPHQEKVHYALGLCQNCYHAKYAQIRRSRMKKKVMVPNGQHDL